MLRILNNDIVISRFSCAAPNFSISKPQSGKGVGNSRYFFYFQSGKKLKRNLSVWQSERRNKSLQPKQKSLHAKFSTSALDFGQWYCVHMLPPIATAQDLSICARCQFRLLFRHLRPCPRKITSTPPRAHHASTEQGRFPRSRPAEVITFNPNDSSFQRRQEDYLWARKDLLAKDASAVSTLGEPAHIWVYKEPVEQLRRRVQRLAVSKEDTNTSTLEALGSNDLVKQLAEEQGSDADEEAFRNIEALRSSWCAKSEDQNARLSQRNFNELSRILRDGFRTKQLLGYYSRNSSQRTPERPDLSVPYYSELYSRTSWRSGATPIPTGFGSLPAERQQLLTELGGDGGKPQKFQKRRQGASLKTTDHPSYQPRGLISTKSNWKTGRKRLLASRIIRDLWHIIAPDEKGSIGQLNAKLRREHLDLLLNHRKRHVTTEQNCR